MAKTKENVPGTNAGDLPGLIRRIEPLTGEKQQLAADIAVVFAEAKAQGYDVKIIRMILRERATETAALAETFRLQNDLLQRLLGTSHRLSRIA